MGDGTLRGVTLFVGGSPNPDVGRGSEELIDPTSDELFRILDDVRTRHRLYATLEAPHGSEAASITVSHPQGSFRLECLDASTGRTLESTCTDAQIVRNVVTACAGGGDDWRTMLDWRSVSDETLRPAKWWQRLLGVRWVRSGPPDPRSTTTDD